LLFGANAVFPMVFIGKTTAWPAQVGDVDVLEGVNNVVANAACVGNVGCFTNINPVVDTATEVLGKVAINVFVNGATFNVGIENEIGHDFAFI